MNVLTEKEQGRAEFRTRLFQSHGWDAKRARVWVLRLAARDLDGDDRHICPECKWLTSKWECCAPEPGSVVADVLQRCSSFVWEKP